jgi:hypothetical protein
MIELIRLNSIVSLVQRAFDADASMNHQEPILTGRDRALGVSIADLFHFELTCLLRNV